MSAELPCGHPIRREYYASDIDYQRRRFKKGRVPGRDYTLRPARSHPDRSDPVRRIVSPIDPFSVESQSMYFENRPGRFRR